MALEKSADDEEERVAATVERLRAACGELGFELTADDRVGEPEAAHLVGYKQESFANLRRWKVGPASYRRRAGESKVISYRLDDLAKWIEGTRED